MIKSTCKKILKKANEGFTLVELIVVIAILAILAGVAVPAYSGYVEKTNKTADEVLMSEIEQGLKMQYYANPESFVSGAVIVSSEGTRLDDANNAFLMKAMEDVFGSEWEELKLQYTGRQNEHTNITLALGKSSFSDGNGGVKQGLLGTVDNLAGTLSDLMQVEGFSITNYGGFADYLIDNGIDYSTNPQKAANSIVPYLSKVTEGVDRNTVKDTLTKVDSWIVTDDAGNTKLSLETALTSTITNGGTNHFASLAATYATMKGFCEWADAQNAGNGVSLSALFDDIPLDTYRDAAGHDQPVMHEPHVVWAIQQELERSGYASVMVPLFQEYISGGYAAKDVDAYFGVIDGIADNKDYILENLDDSSNFYQNNTDYLNTYLNISVAPGEVAAIVTLNDQKAPVVVIIGLNIEE